MNRNILSIMKEDGHEFKYKSSTNGGEYTGPCPFCGGTDRCQVWPNHENDNKSGKFTCRKCLNLKREDAIFYLREYRGWNFQRACNYLGIDLKTKTQKSKKTEQSGWQPRELRVNPSEEWQKGCKNLIDQGVQNLFETEFGNKVRKYLNARGLSDKTIKNNRLGCMEKPSYMPIGRPEMANISTKSIWLPDGIVIPYFYNNQIVRIRFGLGKNYRPERKYHILPGSDTVPIAFDRVKGIVVVVEGEYDAMLIDQEAGDLVSTVAIGVVTTRPDLKTDKLLRGAELILCALDNDEAGELNYKFWQKEYLAKRMPILGGVKDPGEMYQKGISIRKWIRYGIKLFSNKINDNCLKMKDQQVVDITNMRAFKQLVEINSKLCMGTEDLVLPLMREAEAVIESFFKKVG